MTQLRLCSRLLCSVLVLALGVAHASRAAEEFSARLEQANALLAAAETYPQAIALYRDLLAEDPTHREARLRLAQVLSWSGQLDASLEQYTELRRQYPDDLEIQIGEAEVLSWSGDNARALAAFEAILAKHPSDARAARGVARVHRWSGRNGKADRAYRRALALEEDAEARGEWEELRKPLRPRVEITTSTFSDSSDFDRRDAWASVSGFQDADTRVGMRLGWIQVGHPQDDVPLAVRSEHDDDRALDLGVTLDRTLESGPRISLELGGRQWAEAGDSLYVRSRLEHTLQSLGTLGLHLVHEDFTDAATSFEAVQEEVRHTALAGTLYRQLGAKLGAFGRLEVSSISDGNTRQSLYSALIYHPWVAHDLDLSLGGNALRYSDASDSYYDPELDLGVALMVDHRIPLSPAWRFEYQGALGFQSTKEREVSESGTQWSGEARIFWERDPWAVSLRFGVSYSQRSSRYHTQRGGLEIERKF